MLVPVNNYAAEWNPITNQGKVFVQIGSTPPSAVPIENAEEFMIVLLMMGKTAVKYDTGTRALDIPLRPVGT